MEKLLFLIEIISCRLAHRVLFVSPSIRRTALARGMCLEKKSRVLINGSFNGVDALGHFNPQRVTVDRARAEVGIPISALVIGFVGRVVCDKGIIELLMAWHSLQEQFDDLYLLIVGPMEVKNKIPEEVIGRMMSDPRIRNIRGELDPVNYYAAMDVFVLPSYREGFGLVAIEASAMNLPVSTTRSFMMLRLRYFRSAPLPPIQQASADSPLPGAVRQA